MNITFNELRRIKHNLPTGSVSRIAKALNIKEQTVRNYFGANKFATGEITGNHFQPGPDGGIVNLKDTTILKLAQDIIEERRVGQRSTAE